MGALLVSLNSMLVRASPSQVVPWHFVMFIMFPISLFCHVPYQFSVTHFHSWVDRDTVSQSKVFWTRTQHDTYVQDWMHKLSTSACQVRLSWKPVELGSADGKMVALRYLHTDIYLFSFCYSLKHKINMIWYWVTEIWWIEHHPSLLCGRSFGSSCNLNIGWWARRTSAKETTITQTPCSTLSVVDANTEQCQQYIQTYKV